MHTIAIAIASLLTGCGASTSPSGPLPPPPQAACPGTIGSTAGVSCSVTGLKCFPHYDCGSAVAIATCQCSEGHFACVDVTGAAVAAGATPSCPDAGRTAPACPATAEQADFLACGNPGRICTYPSACTSIPAYVQCQCVGAQLPDGTPYRRYECTNPCPFIPPVSAVDAALDSSAAPRDSGGRSVGLDSPAPPAEAAPEAASADAKGEPGAETGTPDALTDALPER